jgi:hypothetical protein
MNAWHIPKAEIILEHCGTIAPQDVLAHWVEQKIKDILP